MAVDAMLSRSAAVVLSQLGETLFDSAATVKVMAIVG
jgi:hypothetical protein